MSNSNYEEIIKNLNTAYFSLHPQMPLIPYKVIFTDNLTQTHLELRGDIKAKLISAGIEKENDYNGRMVLPYAVEDVINILMNTNKVVEYTQDGSLTWMGTFAHELTHAIDFYQMAQNEGLSIYDPLLEVSQYRMFQLWSEYHARKFGYSFLRTMLGVDGDENNKRERIDHILSVELPFHQKKHFDDYHATQDGGYQMYITMQLLGRYSVWCELFPETFNGVALRKSYANALWVCDIFSFLERHNSLESIYDNFEEMRLILKENWTWL